MTSAVGNLERRIGRTDIHESTARPERLEDQAISVHLSETGLAACEKKGSTTVMGQIRLKRALWGTGGGDENASRKTSCYIIDINLTAPIHSKNAFAILSCTAGTARR